MDPDTPRDSSASGSGRDASCSSGHRPRSCDFGVLVRASRGRGRSLDLGLKAMGVVAILFAAGAVVRGLVKARGRGPTIGRSPWRFLGSRSSSFLWFVMMYG